MSSASDEMVTIDVRDMVPRERHPLIFATFDQLTPSQAMLLVNDHDPKPLYYQLMAERPEQAGWEYIEQGPEVWRVHITKLASTTTTEEG